MRPAPITLLLAATAVAEDPATLVHRSLEHLAFRTAGVDMQARMILESARGEKRERRMQIRSRTDGGLARTIIHFLAPPDVTGTKFLLLGNRDRQDDQYLYLPAMKRVRRIMGSQRNQSFMGSDFTYADLEGRDAAQATYAEKGEDTLAGQPCKWIEAKPKTTESSTYGKLELCIRTDTGVALQTKFYDRDGAHNKTATAQHVETIQKHLVITALRMETLGNSRHSTTLLLDHVDFRDDFPPEEFTVRRLEQE